MSEETLPDTMLKDFIAKQPTEVLDNTVLDEQRLSVPTKIKTAEFFKEFKSHIQQKQLTDEKAIYVAALGHSKKTKTISHLLLTGR